MSLKRQMDYLYIMRETKTMDIHTNKYLEEPMPSLLT